MGIREKVAVVGTFAAGVVGTVLARDYVGNETAQYVQGKLPQILEYMQNSTTRVAGNLDEFVGAAVFVVGFGASVGAAYLIDRYIVPLVRGDRDAPVADVPAEKSLEEFVRGNTLN